jgi:hypothetical protein
MPRGDGAGRPRVEQDKLDKFLTFVRDGNTVRAAAGSAGISQELIYKLLRLGHSEREAGKKTKLAKFIHEFEANRALAESDYVTIVKKASTEDVANARFMLAHINRKRWGDRSRVDLYGGVAPIDRAELLRGIQELAKAVRDEVEDPAVLLRINARWKDIIDAWRTGEDTSSKRRRKGDELEPIEVVESKAITAGNGDHGEETDSPAAS